MRMKIAVKKDGHYYLLVVFVSLLILGISIKNIECIDGFGAWDELGYWSNAAYLAGYDWSSAATEFCGYYSYGYSLLLVPILMLTQNGIFAYRCAVILNAFFIVGVFLLLNLLGSIIFEKKDKGIILITAAITSLYSNNLFQCGNAWAECELIFLYTAVVVIMFLLEKKYSLLKLSVLNLLIIYLYFVHNRTIVIAIAFSITALVGLVVRKIPMKDFCICLVEAAVVISFFTMLKVNIRDAVYVEKTVKELGNSVSSFGEAAFVNFTNFEGIRDIILTFVCRFLYFGFTTYGTFFYMVYFSIIKTYQILKNKTFEKVSLGALFFGLSILGLFAMLTLVFSNMHDYQSLLYGRYQDIIIGPVYFLSIMLFLKNIPNKRFIICVLPTFKVLIFLANQIKIYKDYFVINCNVNMYKYWKSTLEGGYDLWKAMFAACIGLVTIYIICIINNNKVKMFAYCIAAILFCHVAISDSDLCYDAVPRDYEEFIEVIKEVHALCEDEQTVYYYSDSNISVNQPIAMNLQLQMFNHNVEIIHDNADIPASGYVVYPRKKNGEEYMTNVETRGTPILEENFILLNYVEGK